MNNQKTKEGLSLGKSILWILMSSVMIKFFSFFSGVTTARLLFPEDFGIISLAATVTGFIDFLKNLGIEAFLISKKELTPHQVNGIYIINICLGLSMTLLLLLAAPIAGKFYHTPEIVQILNYSAFLFSIYSISSIPRSLFIKEMRQDICSKMTVLEGFLQSLLIIIFAYLGFKYLSYVIPIVITSFISAVLYILISRWKFSFNFDFSIIPGLLHYAKSFFARSIPTYFLANSDYVIVGILLGKTILGYYYFGFEKAFLVMGIIQYIAGNALMPFFSKNQQDPQNLINIFFKTVSKLAFIIYPVIFIVVILANEIITVIYGTRWINSILTFQLLAMTMFIKLISVIINNYFDATGKPEQNAKYILILVPIYIPSFYIGATLGGLVGVSISAAIVNLLAGFIIFKLFSNAYKISFSKLVMLFITSLIPVIAQIPFIIAIKWIFYCINLHPIAILLIIPPISLALYLLFSKIFLKTLYEETFLYYKSKILNKLYAYNSNQS